MNQLVWVFLAATGCAAFIPPWAPVFAADVSEARTASGFKATTRYFWVVEYQDRGRLLH
jgi:hypothetical protein